ncbi:centrosomal AT-AC splicing factor-like [Physella acuta]|uniref:centrosomal AT-AC splicing factor-like n=1 Tax=Physella acuta TaxID=109671 RepID=UPI0027DD7B7B|nr:centrosomal AT-AC splicing factor-like [Physella acuta]
MASQTVFVQFRYCSLCRLNHKKGKSHVYSKRHQDLVSNVLKKFLKKINEARTSLQNPKVHDTTWPERDKNFWCYFCQLDVGKHKHHFTAMGECFICHGGLLEHITRSDHVENTVKFLKENKIDLKRTSEFVLSSTTFLKYLEDLDAVCSKFFKEQMETVKKLAAEIKSQDRLHQQIVSFGLLDQSAVQQEKHLSHSGVQAYSHKTNNAFTGEEEKGKKTIQAFGQGLTPLERCNEDDTLGNIYTNALPPWLLPDNEDADSSGIIGPTLEDLEKHRKLEKKSLLPACRVGAKFDHNTEQLESWLPNFGGVWNHGRRTNSGKQFQRRMGKSRFESASKGADSANQKLSSTASYEHNHGTSQKLASCDTSMDNSSSNLQYPSNNNSATYPQSGNISAYGSASSKSSYGSASSTSYGSASENYKTYSPNSSGATDQETELTRFSNTYEEPTVVHTTFNVSLKPYVRKRKHPTQCNNSSVETDSHMHHQTYNNTHNASDSHMYHHSYNNTHNFNAPIANNNNHSYINPTLLGETAACSVSDTSFEKPGQLQTYTHQGYASKSTRDKLKSTFTFIPTPVLQKKN